ncbi:glycosyltransferase family 4 protein [Mongoliitalea lutea]|uniref:Glycosyltransferase subfamily 4-like N-terminal domain-containing protein n=1 Tax=Mongoliitalea lutea TaxID=849756 RepID=A0A8J3G3N2_9BACT|nr:glycosyltransferase family 4 protein [Mongoliitalea lutea]GHB23754.1 hypothetical protein GCM10008106_00420 [Mongoliitalea lutea]
MRILLLIQRPQARGQELFASQIGNELLKHGHHVQLLTLYQQGTFDLPFTGTQNSLNLHAKRNLLHWRPWLRLHSIIKEFQPDIVQANGGDTLLVASLAKKLGIITSKLIFNNGGVVNYYIHSYLHSLLYKFLAQELNACVHVSDFSYQDFQSIKKGKYIDCSSMVFEQDSKSTIFNRSHQRIPQTVIPIGVSHTTLTKPYTSDDGISLVCIAGFTAEKNQRWLIENFEFLLNSNPTITCTFFGDGPCLAECQQLAREKFTDRLIFKGAIEHPWEQIPSNAYLILPSAIEGCPAVIAEAMRYHIPVFASHVGGIPEMIEDGTACFTYDYNSMSSLLEKLKKWEVMPLEEKCTRLKQGFSVAIEKFSLPVQAKRFLNFYQSVCG